MTRLLPHPLLALAFLALWLLLVESVSPGAVLLGAVLAVTASRVLVALGMPKGHLGRLRAVPGLLFDVLVEVVRSNNAVARIILQPAEPGARRAEGFDHPFREFQLFLDRCAGIVGAIAGGGVYVELLDVDRGLLVV